MPCERLPHLVGNFQLHSSHTPPRPSTYSLDRLPGTALTNMAHSSPKDHDVSPQPTMHLQSLAEPSKHQAIQPKASPPLPKLEFEGQEQETLSMSISTPTQTHIETISLSMIDLINTHTFNLPSWSPLIAPSFRASPHPPHLPLNAPPEEFLSFMSELYAENPEWRCRCADLSSQVEGNTGEVFMNIETRGIPEGIVTRSCAVLRFREGKKGGWRCVGFLGANGGAGLEGMGFV